jgi:cell division septation protein DedD
MATPSLSLVESLIGAIPVEEGAALVARVGERATITAKTGSIEVGSVALTVEAMDDLIAQVLPPDQLESLQENGTVHFEFTPPVIGGEFAVLAASTPGDRWLEIRRRSTSIATAPAPAAVAEVVRQAVAPAPAAAPVPAVADESEVAQLLSRFHAPEAAAAAPIEPVLSAAPEAPVLPPSFQTAAPAPVVNADFDLSTTLPAREPAPAPSPAPTPTTQDAAVNDDLSIPANLDFAKATPDFDLDGLSLSEGLPEGPLDVATDVEPRPFEPEDSDHIEMHQPETSGMAKSRFSTSTAASSPLRSRSVVMLSVVLGIVVLSAAGWFAGQRYLSAPPVAVAAPPPAPRKPAPLKPAPRKTTNAPATAAASGTPAATAPVAAAPAAKRRTEAVAQKQEAAPPAPKSIPPQPVAKTNAPPPAPVPAPAAAVSHEGFSVQVAAVRERDEADRIVAKLVNQGYSGYLIRGQGAAAAFYRVRVGAFKDRQAAEEVAVRLERAEGVKPWIVKETQ